MNEAETVQKKCRKRPKPENMTIQAMIEVPADYVPAVKAECQALNIKPAAWTGRVIRT